MSKETAGGLYLTTACRFAAAIDRYSKRVYGKDDKVFRPEVVRRLPAIKKESGRLAVAAYEFARALHNPPAPWPATVAPDVGAMIAQMLRSERDFGKASGADSASEWYRLKSKAERALKWVPIDRRISVMLDLPGDC